MPNLSRPIATLLISVISSLPSFAQQHTVALTFDDLPAAGTINPGEVRSINLAILDSLERHNAPTTGFVVEKRVQEIGDIPGKEILWQWVQHGHDLGNHGFSHSDFDELTVEQMEQEIVSGEKSLSDTLRKVGKTPRYFRFPMNHTGDTAAKHDAVASFLARRGYRVATCTIDNEDFVFNSAYLIMLAKKDKASAERLRSDYLAYTSTEIDYYSALNKQVFGYEPPHVMLLHVSRLNADVIDAVLSLRNRGPMAGETVEQYIEREFAPLRNPDWCCPNCIFGVSVDGEEDVRTKWCGDCAEERQMDIDDDRESMCLKLKASGTSRRNGIEPPCPI